MAVTTRACLPVAYLCSSRCDDTMAAGAGGGSKVTHESGDAEHVVEAAALPAPSAPSALEVLALHTACNVNCWAGRCLASMPVRSLCTTITDCAPRSFQLLLQLWQPWLVCGRCCWSAIQRSQAPSAHL